MSAARSWFSRTKFTQARKRMGAHERLKFEPFKKRKRATSTNG
ncbi:hypothetical protein CAMGR0001_2529 [Campylobacter gracilis RM3268]|uniref:Uncharacterized protein n=1 Tax=Campylobacter gracilis RM3268 TaxID=553220 RepID=C8PEP0_9BACT|nr:hypothetical protein CAMGR0001_2529 [Campylobacter gracilis RM3268]